MSPSRLLSQFISGGLVLSKMRSASVALNIVKSGCDSLYISRTMASKCLNLEDINPNVKVMEYAVRGPLVIRGSEIEKELEQVGRKIFYITLK